MTVEEFNINKGLYFFVIEDFETEWHSHPAIEILIAKRGAFTLDTDRATHKNLKFAIIPENQRHRLSIITGELKILLIEHHSNLVLSYLGRRGIDLEQGFFSQSIPPVEILHLEKLIQQIHTGKDMDEYDERISRTIHFLNRHDLEYAVMLKTLCEITHLSESRLSHLFKSTIGISLKKYLIWSKLKSTIKNHLDSKEDLVTSLVKSGFYDQPHFSRSFKNMLGVKPSKAYNSRILQVSSNLRY